jgi:hypothetical protein
MRVESNTPAGKVKGKGWIHKMTESIPVSRPPRKAEPKPDVEHWTRLAQECFQRDGAVVLREQLSTELGVSVDALTRLGVGLWFDDYRKLTCSTWPERRQGGKVVGIVRRYRVAVNEGGNKLAMKGGTVLTDQTLFWVGAKFGFGFYRIGNLQVAFVFNSEQPGINDSVAIPNLSGQLIDSTCVFSDDHCWFFTTMREAGVTTNRCYVIGVDGLIKATASAPSGSRSWLGTIRGKTAIGLPNSTGAPARLVLFSPSSSGIVQVRLEQDKIEIAADFPETAPFVDANTHLQIAPEGIYAAKNDSIYLLQLA